MKYSNKELNAIKKEYGLRKKQTIYCDDKEKEY